MFRISSSIGPPVAPPAPRDGKKGCALARTAARTARTAGTILRTLRCELRAVCEQRNIRGCVATATGPVHFRSVNSSRTARSRTPALECIHKVHIKKRVPRTKNDSCSLWPPYVLIAIAFKTNRSGHSDAELCGDSRARNGHIRECTARQRMIKCRRKVPRAGRIDFRRSTRELCSVQIEFAHIFESACSSGAHFAVCENQWTLFGAKNAR